MMMKQMNKTAQKGFTLIELMIVVAIIGILAAIAIPAYQDYTGRAQASEALSATAGVRTDIGIYLAENGDLPVDGDDAAIDGALDDLEGKYFAQGGAQLTDVPGQIEVTFDAGVHNGGSMTVTAVEGGAGNDSGNIARWECDGLEDKFLPSACQVED